MAKIVTPRLPEATEEYSREQVSQLIQTLDQVIFVLNNTYIPEKLQSMGNSVVTKNRKWTGPKQSCLFHWGNSFQSPWRLPNRGCA